MAAAGGRRKGRRTHRPVDEDELRKIPRSFVIKHGRVTKTVKALSRDLRRVYRPWTATNLRESKRAALKDYTSVGSALNISHMVVATQRGDSVYLTFMKTLGDEGPSCHFRLLSYSLVEDINRGLAKPRCCDSDFHTSPLIVTQGFDVKKKKEPSTEAGAKSSHLTPDILKEIKHKIFLEAFPTISRGTGAEANAQAFNGVRRVLLFSYQGNEIFEVRHYAILKTEAFKNVVHVKRKTPAPSPYKNELKEEAAVAVKTEEFDEDEKVDFLKKNLSLVELGPRIKMQFVRFQNKLSATLTLTQEELESINSAANLETETDAGDGAIDDGREALSEPEE